ncbi:choline dehydrogenase [Xylariomycetidae sp. FL0641]|nr:choline dehydrogenase [Xylariomycetidae sp. FL0641]
MDSGAFDVIVVGGGTAGCVLASRLSEDKGLRVLLMEAGEDLTSDERSSKPPLGSDLLATSANWGFRTTPQESLGFRETTAPAGRLLGGSSVVNGFAFLPNSRANIDAWAKLGNAGWEWSSFRESRNRFRLAGDSKPDDRSPLQLTIPDEDSEWPRVWRETLANMGYPEPKEPLSEKLLGSLMEVVLSAGALDSPRLPELSGIGIEVLVDHPGVGENLQSHPMIIQPELRDALGEDGLPDHRRAAARRPRAPCPCPTTTPSLARLIDRPSLAPPRDHGDPAGNNDDDDASGCCYYMTAPGHMAFAGDDGTPERPPTRRRPLPRHRRAPGAPAAVAGLRPRHPTTTTTTGTPSSSSGLAIDPRYFAHPLDLEVLARHRPRHAAAAAPRVAATATTTWIYWRRPKRSCAGGPKGAPTHWTGSCAHAAPRARARGGVVVVVVVDDPALRVHGCGCGGNLRVGDAGVLPPSRPRSNVQGAVYAAAEHGGPDH